MNGRRSIAAAKLLALVFCAVCLSSGILLAGSAVPASHRQDSRPPQIKIQLGPMEVIRGPDRRTDNPFNTSMSASSLLGYIANGFTEGYVGGSLETLRPFERPVLDAGTAFDSCGAWLNSVWQDGDVIRGWYHAETDCDYPTTHKSVAYAESHDGGRTFIKPDYPDNQVITATPRYSDPDEDDEGDQRVIRVGDYLYMYFVASRDWQVRLARSHISDGGRPGTWHKYYNGRFSEPGLGGESSPIDPSGALTRSWISFNAYLDTFIGFSYITRDYSDRSYHFAGFGFTVSPDGIHDWMSLPYLVLSSEGEYWGRSQASKELTEYPSLISIYGDGEEIGDLFWLYYMYLNPGETFDRRYLVRRKVRLTHTPSTAPVDLVPRAALSKYRHSADTWFTTTTTDPNYELVETTGYLFTDEVPNSQPVYDCYIDFWDDHMLTVPAPSGEICGEGARYLRRVGWISTVPFDNSVRVYRCFDPTTTNHSISLDPHCGGAEAEWPMGYLATEPPFPEPQFVALSNYYSAEPQDHWTTTATPPQDYVFEARLGYLFTTQRSGSIPAYDCYLPNERDRMLDIDPNCGNPSVHNLGRMGWISTEPFPSALPIYRCHDSETYDHFVTTDPDCEDKTLEWRIGYVATAPLVHSIGQKVYLPAVLHNR